MIEIGLNAGHGLHTSGKRCLKSIDPNETREWVLNNRIAVKIEEKLNDYEGIKIHRLDDRTGRVDIPLEDRTDMANRLKLDFVDDIHHNAGINGGSGGGIVVIRHHITGQATKDYQNIMYDKLIKHTGMKGNRSNPKPTQNLHMCRETDMPTLTVEHCYMDSIVDTPIILTEKFAEQCANAHVEFFVEVFNLKKKEIITEEKKETQTIYRVQVGAYGVKANAEKMLSDLKAAGFNGFIREDVITVDKPKEPEIIIPDKPEIIVVEKKSTYFKKGNAQIIKTRPDNIKIEILGDNLHNADVYGVNGTLYDERTAPYDSPESCVMIAMNDGKALSNNAQFNGWQAPPRATLIYHNNNKLGFRQLQNINTIRDITQWAIGGFMVKPYMDFKNEQIPSGVNYKTAHTYIAMDLSGNIYLIVKPNHMIRDIIPLMDELDITNAIVLDGGGSSQLRHPDGNFKASRKINSAILLKEV